MAWLPQRTNAAVPWTPVATPTTSTASTVSTLATPMSSVGSTSSQLSTATVQRPAAGFQTALPSHAQVAQAFGTWGRGRRKSKRTQPRRKTRRGGGEVRPGMVCTFPSQAEKDAGEETREFEEGEVVCFGGQGGKNHVTATYLRTDTTGDVVKHVVKIRDEYPEGHSVPWWNVGKYTQAPASSGAFTFDDVAFNTAFTSALGTGAAGQGTGTGSSGTPLLAQSNQGGVGRRRTYRGGFTRGAIPYGKTCVFPDASMMSETRTFTANEIVCYREPMQPVRSANYISTPSPQAHLVEKTLDDTQLLVPWFMVGKLVDSTPTTSNQPTGPGDGTSASGQPTASPGFSNEPSGTGASGQPATATGSQNGPLLGRSMGYGIPRWYDGGRKTKRRPRRR